jgi:hypothetical protein
VTIRNFASRFTGATLSWGCQESSYLVEAALVSVGALAAGGGLGAAGRAKTPESSSIA